VIAIAVMLEGIGPAAFLITIPTFLPIYQRLGLSRYDLLFVAGLGAGVVNFAPWGGPMGRASLALHLPPVPLWIGLIPVEIVGVVITLGVAAWLGKRVERRLAAGGEPAVWTDSDDAIHAPVVRAGADHSHGKAPISRSIYWFNVVLTVAAMGSMIFTKLPPALVFLVALTLALLVNFRSAASQVAQIRLHAAEAVTISTLMLGAGCFIGIMTHTGMFPRLAELLIELVPGFMGRYIHVIIGCFSIFLGILFSADAFYLGLMPMVNSVAHAHGIPPESVAHAMMIGECVGFSASPAVPAAFLAAGLAGCDLGQFIRYAVLRLWLVSLVMLAAAILFGIVKI
jgi:CitMHS family citrate-Mg2+:H+ or citrate-Ca2+:H+ symporter